MDGNSTGNPVQPDKPGPDVLTKAQSNEQRDYESASQATVDYSNFTPQLRPRRLWPRIVGWVVLVLVILAVLGGGAYWVMHHKSSPPPKTSQSTQQKTSQDQPNIASTTKQYDSSNFNLSFNYPENWSISDTGNGKLTATSPAVQLTDADGQSQTGQIVMTIQNEDTMDFSMFKQGNAVAVLPSQKIAYTNPSPTQRANTYLSFLQYATTTIHGALDGVYVTGDFGYQKDQAIPEVDITKVDPVITVTFEQCGSAACTGTLKPLSISSNMWSDTTFSGPIVKMIESLAIQ